MTHKCGFIGFGNMAKAIWAGMKKNGMFEESDILICEKNDALNTAISNEFNIKTDTIQAIAASCHFIILAIKPQQLSDVLTSLPRLNTSQCIISILAGISIDTITQLTHPSQAICRVMPNTPALVGKGMSACAFHHVLASDRSQILSIFSHLGKCIEVNERQLDIITAISGSGPAFFYTMANDIMATGMAYGLSEEDARLLISQTMIGAGQMLQTQTDSPETLAKNVTSKGGTTEAGLRQYTLTEGLHQMITAAYKRSVELSKGAI